MQNMESLITKVIVIKDAIIFYPSYRELKNELTGDVVTLHTPGNFCLLHLLANRSRILTKEELIKVSWNNEIITDNTFYQMIFNLRQNLAKVGGNNVIITVPRRGLRINPEIPVGILSAGIQGGGISKNVRFNSIQLDPDNHINNRKRNFLLVVLSFFLLLLSGLLYTSGYDKYAFDDYQQTEYKMCTVHYDEIIGKKNISAIILKSGIDCSRQRYLIFNQSENHSRLSVISCSASAVKTKSCSLSLYVQ